MAKKFVFSYFWKRALAICRPSRTHFAGMVGFLWLLISASGHAHSGFLDSTGCHPDQKKGNYHCHQGPLAGKTFASKEEALQALEKQKIAQANSKKGQSAGKNQTSDKKASVKTTKDQPASKK